MRSIRIQNPILNSYLTDIATDYVSGAAITARSNNSFAANDLAVFGNPTEELTELKKINSLTGNTGFVLASDLKFQHNKATPIYKSLWDSVAIEADYGAGFSLITTSSIQWDSRSNETIYFDSNGTNTTSYRFRFYNSVTATYSEYSPTLTGAGFSKFQTGYIIREARRIAGDPAGRVVRTDELLRDLTRAKNIIRARNARYWFWKVDGYLSGASILATATNDVYSLSSITDLGVIDYVEFKYTQGAANVKYIIRKLPDAEFLSRTRDLNRPADNQPRTYRFLPPDANSAKGYIQLDNKILNSGVGTMYISYYKEEPDYNSVDDTTSIIMPEILEDYLISIIYGVKGNDAMRDKYMQHFTGPDNREKTLALEKLEGIALLDELDKQYKKAQGQPGQLIRFMGQKGFSRTYGSRSRAYSDERRENYFRDEY